jgi:neopullulanase
MKFNSILCLLLFASMAIAVQGQKTKVPNTRINPPFWWVGMASNKLELLVSGEDIGKYDLRTDNPDIHIVSVDRFESGQYLAAKLEIGADVQPGTIKLRFLAAGKEFQVDYQLKSRKENAQQRAGLQPSDCIYLLMPDRFSNGDPSNDSPKGMNQSGIARDSLLSRHGGDLKGISNHLDYFKDLGVTALWLNPVLENNEPKESYHGYAITDHYRVDPRLGDNATYLKLIEDCHAKGLKMVMDMVYNHWGDKHYLYRNLPSGDWVHQQKEFRRTSYRDPVLIDPHASRADKDLYTDGWFDHHMPDLNQKNPHVAAYLIQNSIWWIEYADLDAFRIDTYLYSDLEFMHDLIARIQLEYKGFGIFGETWVQGVPNQVHVTVNNLLQPNNGNLPGVTDFQLYYAINDALTQKMGWTEGVSRMYLTLAQDYLYAQPENNVVFLDNHDLSRFYATVGDDFRKFKMGIAWLLTTRGIPMLYYGTELLMSSFANPDAKVRADFPGGWIGDKNDKFSPAGRSPKEQEAFAYVQKMLKWRVTNQAVREGKLVQFIPQDGIYVYFRFTATETLMIAMNCTDDSKSLGLDRFAEHLNGYQSIKDVEAGSLTPLGKELKLAPWTTAVLELVH